jgi:hypothetical protein
MSWKIAGASKHHYNIKCVVARVLNGVGGAIKKASRPANVSLQRTCSRDKIV